MRLWTFATASFLVTADTVPDSDVDTSYDETGETDEKLASGEWEAFGTVVKVETHDGVELGTASLWGSIYADPREFRDHLGIAEKGRADGCNYGSYFSDLVREAVGEARTTLATLQGLKVRTAT